MHREKLFVMMGDVWARWKNNYRFASHDRLTSEFRRLKLDRGIKGEILKPNSDIVIRNAIEIINMGKRRWTSEKSWRIFCSGWGSKIPYWRWSCPESGHIGL